MIKTSAIFIAVAFSSSAMADYASPVSTPLSITDIHVNKDWSVRQRMEVINKVETDLGVSLLGEQNITYNSAHERVRVLKAYTIQPDGTKVQVSPDRIRTQDDPDEAKSGVFSESKAKVIIFPNLKVGSQTYYLVESIQHTPDFPKNYSWTEYFSPHRKFGRVEVRFEHDPSLAIRVEGRGMMGGRVEPDSGVPGRDVRYVLRYSQETAAPIEPGMVSYTDFSPKFTASSFRTYADVAQAYQVRARPKADVTPELAAHARVVIGDADSDDEKIARLYSWVSRNIRYLGVYAGAGGYVPHSALDVLHARYGDCKDHATLLEALLRSVGIESSQVLINSGNAYTLPEVPNPGVFDHVINYIPSKDLFVDSTARFVPIGSLPPGDVGKSVLITSTGQVVRTPLDDVAKDKSITTTKLVLHPDGQVTGQSQTESLGYFQVIGRSQVFRDQYKTDDEIVGNFLSKSNESGTGHIHNPDPLDLKLPWVVTSEFKLDPIVNLPGTVALTIPVGLAQGRFQALASIKSDVKNQYPHVCGSSSHQESIDLDIDLPTHVTRLPSDVTFKTKTLSYTATYRLSGSTIKIDRTFVADRSKSVCDKEDALEWTQLTKVLQRDLRQQFFLE